MGYPQVSFGGLFSTIGDPTSFVSRENRSYELYDNVMLDRGNHHLKFGGYLFRLRVQSGQPDQRARQLHVQRPVDRQCVRRLPARLSERRRRSASAAPTSTAAARGSTSTARTTGRCDSNLTLNYGLRYEINSQMTDVDNRLSAIDLAERPLRHRQRRQRQPLAERRRRCCPQIPIPYVTSEEAGWTRGLLRPSYLRFAPRARRRLGARRRRQDRRQRRLRRVPESVGLQRPAGARVDAAVLLREDGHRRRRRGSADAARPSTVLLAPANGTVGGNTMDWDFRTEYAKNYSVSVQRAAHADDDVRGELPAFGDRRRRQLHRAQRAGARARRDRAAPSGASAGQHHGDSLGRLLDLQRRDVPRRAAAVARAGVHRRPTRCRRRSTMRPIPGARRSRPTCRRTCATWPPKRRERASIIGIASSAASPTRCRISAAAGSASTLGSDWQVNGIVLLESGAPFTVNLGTDRANIGAGPAQRPDQTCDPNEGGAQTAQQWFNTSCFALQPQFTFGNAPRNSVLSPGYADVDVGVQKDVALGERHAPAVPVGDLQSAEPHELRRAEPDRVHAELRPHLQRQAAASDAVRRQGALLIPEGRRCCRICATRSHAHQGSRVHDRRGPDACRGHRRHRRHLHRRQRRAPASAADSRERPRGRRHGGGAEEPQRSRRIVDEISGAPRTNPGIRRCERVHRPAVHVQRRRQSRAGAGCARDVRASSTCWASIRRWAGISRQARTSRMRRRPSSSPTRSGGVDSRRIPRSSARRSRSTGVARTSSACCRRISNSSSPIASRRST